MVSLLEETILTIWLFQTKLFNTIMLQNKPVILYRYLLQFRGFISLQPH